MLEGIIGSIKESRKELIRIEKAEHPGWTEDDWKADSFKNDLSGILFDMFVIPYSAFFNSL